MNVTVINHPLVRHKLTLMREADYSICKFCALATRLIRLMAYEASHDFEVEKYIIDGRCGSIEDDRIKGRTLTAAPILCAGSGMFDGVLDLTLTVKISAIRLQYDGGTLKPVSCFEKFVDSMDERPALTIGPILATGGSIVATIDFLKAKGCHNIKTLVLVTAPKGVKATNEVRPDVAIYAATPNGHLNEHGYTIPGLSNAGDKTFSAC